jgi:hypothetical protein
MSELLWIFLGGTLGAFAVAAQDRLWGAPWYEVIVVAFSWPIGLLISLYDLIRSP